MLQIEFGGGGGGGGGREGVRKEVTTYFPVFPQKVLGRSCAPRQLLTTALLESGEGETKACAESLYLVR